ncbi:GNAT family N-acetyltransferase [Candidatus Latescibacterota bacterium]
MQVEQRSVSDLAGLAEAYNQELTGVPCFFPVTPDEFEAGVGLDWRGRPLGDALTCRSFVVASEGDTITSFAEVAVAELAYEPASGDQQKAQKHGLIRFLSYAPGRREAGEAVIHACEDYLKGQAVGTIYVFTPQDFSYRFHNMGFGMLSDRQGHVHGLLAEHGYGVYGTAAFLSRSTGQVDEPDVPDAAAEVKVTSQTGRGSRPNVSVEVLLGSEEIASCTGLSAGEFVAHDQAQTACYIAHLKVSPREQGKGWGRYALQRTHREVHRAGYETAFVATGGNPRALLLYTNHGYEVISTLSGYSKHGLGNRA